MHLICTTNAFSTPRYIMYPSTIRVQQYMTRGPKKVYTRRFTAFQIHRPTLHINNIICTNCDWHRRCILDEYSAVKFYFALFVLIFCIESTYR
jgi:hypothetical protein